MQRRAYVPGTALAAALLAAMAGLTGCTGGSDDDGGGDAKPGDPSVSSSTAEPGKYRTLPEPCGAAGRGTLRSLLPGLDELDEEERDQAYEGQAAVTYDTDRRVGCRWKAESPTGTRHLDVDFERVVSYDAAVSDADRAQALYDAKAEKADIPAPGSDDGEEGGEESGEPSASASESDSDKGADEPAPGTGPSDSASGSASDSESGSGSGKNSEEAPPPDASADPETAPRALDDLGEVAFIDDRLVTTDSGVHRDVKVVFRVSNVLVTVAYDHWATQQSALPDSEDLQSKAQRLAGELSGRFGD